MGTWRKIEASRHLLGLPVNSSCETWEKTRISRPTTAVTTSKETENDDLLHKHMRLKQHLEKMTVCLTNNLLLLNLSSVPAGRFGFCLLLSCTQKSDWPW